MRAFVHPRTCAVALTLTLSSFAAHAQSAVHFSPAFRFTEQSGEQLFANVCQGCHMPDAKGAVGAGRYPALANNTNLAASGYPVGIVIHGQKAMPPLGDYFTDVQIANVVNYIRSNFGNHYTDAVTPADVKTQR